MNTNRGFITIALMGIVVTLVAVLMIVIPVVTTKFHIQRYLQVEYNYNNGEMTMMDLMSYPDVREGLGVYASGLADNGAAAGGAFSKTALQGRAAGLLDNLTSDGCYALYYDAQPYGATEDSWTLITKADTSTSGATCSLGSVSKTFLPMPQGMPQVMLVLKTS